jgi:ribonuclease BN (tRNA processing enzyme)
MEIVLLGTGTPTPSLKRMSSGYMVRVGADVILFDHGPGAHHRLLEAGVRAVDVGHVFFTHLHYDHCLDYVRLLMTRWDQSPGDVPELKVYGPPHTARMTEQLIGEDGVFGPDLEARIGHQLSLDTFGGRGGVPPRRRPAPEVTEMRSGDVVEGADWRVEAASVVHVQPYLPCYGFRLESDAGTFAYSGDCGPCAGMERLARDADVLVHMCQYVSGSEPSPEYAAGCMGHLELARLAQDAGVRNLVLSHVSEQMDVPGVRERLIREMGAIFEGNLFFGEDLMRIPIGDPLTAAMK